MWVVVAVCSPSLVVAAAGSVVIDHARDDEASATPTAPPVALTVTSVTPTGTSVAAGSTVSVQFSTDLAPG